MWTTRLKPYADLISAIGALLLFFSWLATNTLGERFRSVKDSYDDADATWRIHQKLDSIRTSIDSVGALNVYILQNLAQLRFENLPPGDRDKGRAMYKANDLRWYLSSIQGNARQFDYGSDFCALMLEHSAIDKNPGSWVAALQENCRAINILKDQKDQILARASTALESGDDMSAEQAIQQAHDELKPLIDQYASLLPLVVNASNERRKELKVALHKTGARAELTKRFAVGFYIIGSIMILAGTAVGKFLH